MGNGTDAATNAKGDLTNISGYQWDCMISHSLTCNIRLVQYLIGEMSNLTNVTSSPWKVCYPRVC